MGMTPFEQGSRSRAAREGGWLGRRRNYKCRQCGDEFQVDTRKPLPEDRRICPDCQHQNSLAIQVANHQGNWTSYGN